MKPPIGGDMTPESAVPFATRATTSVVVQRPSRVRWVSAIAGVLVVAVFGLWFGPLLGEGTDDRAASLVEPALAISLPRGILALAPRTDQEERWRFALQGVVGCVVLLYVIAKRRRPSVTVRSAQDPST